MPYSEESDLRLHATHERIGAFALVSDDLMFQSVSPTFTRLLGYTEDEVRGKSISSFIQEGGLSVGAMEMKRLLYKGSTWISDVILRHKDGTPAEVRITIAPAIEAGVITGYLALCQRSLVPHSLFGLDDVLYRYRSGLNKVVALAIVDSQGRIQEVNELFSQMFGYADDAIIGKHLGTLTKQGSATEFPQHVWDAISKGDVYTSEVEAYREDGRRVYARMTVAPAEAVSSDVIASFDAYLVIYQDITKESEMRLAQNELAVEAAKQQMLNGAIHNISNLQQGVLAANSKTLTGAQSLASAFDVAAAHFTTIESVEERSAFLDGVHRIVKASIDQILESAREERHAIDETVAVLNSFRREQRNIRVVADESVSAFVQRTLNTFSLQAARHNIAVSISSMIDAQVRWPTAQVHQIVFNLLINAQQAIAEQVEKGLLAAHRGRIELAILDEDEDILFYVKDNGGGFHVPLHQLFTPRFTTKQAGSGIGLHTSAIMAQSMGGTLTADNSAIGGHRGAQFLLRVPRVIEAKGAA